MGDRPGCLTLIGIYCLGTYLLVPLAIAADGWHGSFMFAPVVIPAFFLLGVHLIGNSEVPIDVGFLCLAAALWMAFLVGVCGLFRFFSGESRGRWPFIVIIGAYAIGAVWIVTN